MRRALLAAAGVAVVAVGLAVLAAGRGDATEAAAPPTYYGRVGSILNEKCAGCHSPGGIAPFSLASAKDARPRAAAVAAAVEAGRMPPWPPGRDSPAYIGQGARVLSDAEKDAIAAWAAAGGPVGTPRALPKPRREAQPRGAQALTLAPAKPYRPVAPSGGNDDYHCFLLDPKLKRDTFITGATIKPGAPAIVHHVILFEAAGTQAAAATRMNAAAGGAGWTCFGGPGLPADASAAVGGSSLRFGAPQWLAAWVPGHVSGSLPKGRGILVRAGSKVVMQVHYNLAKGSLPDRSRAVLTTAPATAGLEPLETMLLAAPVELPCPRGTSGPLCNRSAAINDLALKYGAGAGFLPNALLFLCGKTIAEYAQGDGSTSCDRPVQQRLTVYGVAGHMHLRGRDVAIVANAGTPRERTLLHIPAWDFHWQDAYYLQKPIPLAPGDTVRLSCRFDASAGGDPRYVVWGEGTTDEMCLGLLSVGVG